LAPQQGKQLDLFTDDNQQRQHVHMAMDNVNHRYGEFTLAPARLLDKSAMPNVIAPA